MFGLFQYVQLCCIIFQGLGLTDDDGDGEFSNEDETR